MLLPEEFALAISNSILQRVGGRKKESERARVRASERASEHVCTSEPPRVCFWSAQLAVPGTLLPASLMRGDVSLDPVAIKGLRGTPYVRPAREGKQALPFTARGNLLGTL